MAASPTPPGDEPDVVTASVAGAMASLAESMSAAQRASTGSSERAAAHVLVPGGAVAAIVGGIAIAFSEPSSKLPAVAFGSPFVLAGAIALAFFYGGLLILMPTVRGLFSGEWPIEVSARGARFAEVVGGQQDFTAEVTRRLVEVEAILKDQQRIVDSILDDD